MMFYLGTHQVDWLDKANVPLFVSRRRLSGRRKLPRATASWALDSGGFTELSINGRWGVAASAYAGEIRRYRSEIGSLAWAAPQDWMCEPHVVNKTGLSVREHQARTIASVLELRAHDVTVIPVLQGWALADYQRHVDAYSSAGIDLAAEPVIGVGTICRRQSTQEAARIIRTLARYGLKLHAFGAKATGLRLYSTSIVSADSMAWSFGARTRKIKMPGCSHTTCASCMIWALEWRKGVVEATTPRALPLFGGAL